MDLGLKGKTALVGGTSLRFRDELRPATHRHGLCTDPGGTDRNTCQPENKRKT